MLRRVDCSNSVGKVDRRYVLFHVFYRECDYGEEPTSHEACVECAQACTAYTDDSLAEPDVTQLIKSLALGSIAPSSFAPKRAIAAKRRGIVSRKRFGSDGGASLGS